MTIRANGVAKRSTSNGHAANPFADLSDLPLQTSVIARLLCEEAPSRDRINSLAKAVERLSDDAITDPALRLIFREILVCAQETNEAPSHHLIESRLRARGVDVRGVIGDDLLSDLAKQQPHAWIGDGEFDRLNELAKRRDVVRQARSLIEIASNMSGSLQDVIDYAEGISAGIDAPDENRIRRLTIGDLVNEYPGLRKAAIDGMLRRGESANIISTSKIGKSWLVYYMAFAFVLKMLLFDRFPTAGGRVLIVDNELHPDTLASRFRTVANAMGVKWDDVKDRVEVWSLRGNLRSVFELSDEFCRIPPGTFDLIIFDAKYRLVGEDASENDNAAETRFHNQIDRLADQTDAAIMLVHHSSKGEQGSRRVTDVGSGAGAQSRAADCHLILREHEEPNVVVLEAAVRSFAPIDPLGLRWQFPLWVPDDSIDTGRLKGRPPPGQQRQRERDREADNLVLTKCGTWQSNKQLQKATGMGQARVSRSVCRLIQAGLLNEDIQTNSGNKTQVYRT